MPTNNPSIFFKVAGAGSIWITAVLLTLLARGGAAAAAPDVRIAGVDCAGDPEVVQVKNFGDEDQDLTGWELQSDGNDPFDLTPAGTIPAGGSVFVESGPGAQATFKWSSAQVFRDNDPTDYVRLVDNAGAAKGETACAQATATPTSAPAATPTPTLAPTANGIPNGGGPPGAPEGVLSPVLLIYAGGAVIGGVAAIGITWMGLAVGIEGRRKRRYGVAASQDGAGLEAAAAPADPEPPAPAGSAPLRPVVQARQAAPAQPLLLALIVAIAAAILVALLVQSQDSTRPR
jgi:hypothetical protein